MSELGPVEQPEEDFRIEITDLDKPDAPGGNFSSRFGSILLAWQRPENWRRLSLASMFCFPLIFILLVLLSIGSDLNFFFANALHIGVELLPVGKSQTSPNLVPRITATAQNHTYQQDGLACLLDAQWSPNSELIAVLGYQHDCPEANDYPGILNIYEASNGKLIAQWQIDDTILNILNPPASPTGYAVSSFGSVPESINDGEGKVIGFRYSSVLWSPDGHRLAVSFMTSLQQQPMHGLLLMNADGQDPQLMLQPQHVVNELPVEWDLSTKMGKPFQPIQPTLQFRWGKDGTLSSKMLLSYNSVPSISMAANVGSPEGETFTIWQPGYTALTNMSGLSAWSTSFEAWSPDGRYIIDSISQAGLMKPGNRLVLDTQTLEQMRISNMPLLPAHDVALLQVAQTSSVVAWRPDGRIMAAFNYYDSVSLYDCVTGRRIASLPLPFRNQPLVGNAALLRWSPNGSHLLLSSSWGGTISLWGPDQLPR